MSLHVIVGAGLIGSATARLLTDSGEQVRIVTRRGTGPEHPAVERVAADATDAARLRELTAGAAALYNCANPPYHRWPTDWPPLHQAMLSAAEAAGAVLAITSNLYGYGPVDRPMTEDMPLAATSAKGRVRADMWRTALAAHEAGRVRVTEARGSDYLGPGAQSMVSERVVPALLAGRTVQVPANLDAPHSFTYTTDVARTLVALAGDERAWGRPWHVPTNPPMTIREVAAAVCRLAGLPAPKLRRLPDWLVWTAGAFSPEIREFREVSYQFRRPFVLDSSLATKTFGLEPTPMDEALRATIGAQPAH
jgi:nucleoside-diphosphate-sugar epimerase